MRDRIEYGVLNAYYGGMLTEYQREIIRLYCDCDMSLAEVSEELGVSRQAIRDVLVRAEARLVEWEEKLGLIKKVKSVSSGLTGLIEGADEMTKEDIIEGLSRLLGEIKEI